jgi:hypothetical protein
MRILILAGMKKEAFEMLRAIRPETGEERISVLRPDTKRPSGPVLCVELIGQDIRVYQ